DFTPCWSGQAGPLGRRLPAKALTRLLAAEALETLERLCPSNFARGDDSNTRCMPFIFDRMLNDKVGLCHISNPCAHLLGEEFRHRLADYILKFSDKMRLIG